MGVAMPHSRGPSRPQGSNSSLLQVTCVTGGFLTAEPPRKPLVPHQSSRSRLLSQSDKLCPQDTKRYAHDRGSPAARASFPTPDRPAGMAALGPVSALGLNAFPSAAEHTKSENQKAVSYQLQERQEDGRQQGPPAR